MTIMSMMSTISNLLSRIFNYFVRRFPTGLLFRLTCKAPTRGLWTLSVPYMHSGNMPHAHFQFPKLFKKFLHSKDI